jgi:hypothetical protein
MKLRANSRATVRAKLHTFPLEEAVDTEYMKQGLRRKGREKLEEPVTII